MKEFAVFSGKISKQDTINDFFCLRPLLTLKFKENNTSHFTLHKEMFVYSFIFKKFNNLIETWETHLQVLCFERPDLMSPA